MEKLFTPQMPTIITLFKGCKSAQIVRTAAEVPAGCGSAVVTSSVIIHTLVRVSYYGGLAGRDCRVLMIISAGTH